MSLDQSMLDSTPLFTSAPVTPRKEMTAYESLWLQPNAWFANIAALFDSHPGALPSELVTATDLLLTGTQLQDHLGDRLRQIGIRVHGTDDYPDKLRDAAHPPELLYFRGCWDYIDTPSVAIVGTRQPSVEGCAHAERIATSLVKHGYTIVSGLARGIDTVAHRTAIAASGRTIAVIGTPLFSVYPRENEAMQEEIAQKHLLISQVPFLRYSRQHYKANSLFFPERNVTMSAITQATIIVEAGNTSGTLVQARAALKQGRLLFILDSCFRNPELTWPERFARQGAIRVQNVTQIVEALRDRVQSPTQH